MFVHACGSQCTKLFYACWLIHSNKAKTTVTSISNDKKCTPHRSQLHSLILIYKLYIEKKEVFGRKFSYRLPKRNIIQTQMIFKFWSFKHNQGFHNPKKKVKTLNKNKILRSKENGIGFSDVTVAPLSSDLDQRLRTFQCMKLIVWY